MALLSLRSVGRSSVVDPRIFNWSPAPSFVSVVLLKLAVVAVLLLRSHLPPRVAVLLPPAELTFTNHFGALPSAPPKLQHVSPTLNALGAPLKHHNCTKAKAGRISLFRVRHVRPV